MTWRALLLDLAEMWWLRCRIRYLMVKLWWRGA